jgi:hypothetical protein
MKYTVTDVLKRAREHQDKHGWCQGSLQTSDGNTCILGALLHVTDRLEGITDEERELLQSQCEERIQKITAPHSIPSYNDHRIWTAREARAVFTAAIDAEFHAMIAERRWLQEPVTITANVVNSSDYHRHRYLYYRSLAATTSGNAIIQTAAA